MGIIWPIIIYTYTLNLENKEVFNKNLSNQMQLSILVQQTILSSFALEVSKVCEILPLFADRVWHLAICLTFKCQNNKPISWLAGSHREFLRQNTCFTAVWNKDLWKRITLIQPATLILPFYILMTWAGAERSHRT